MTSSNTTSVTHDFDKVLSRKGTSSMKWDRYRDQDVLPFWVADMDFEIAPPIQSALQKRLQHSMFGYTLAPEGLAPAVMGHLEREYGWRVQPDWIVWLPGVVAGLAAGCRAYCDPGDQIMVNPPIYHHFFDSHDVRHQHLLRVPLKQEPGRWTYDLPAMEAACTDKTRLLMMCSPQNPTGTVFTKQELQDVAALCEAKDLIMISDEIHCDLIIDELARHTPTAQACPEQSQRIVTLMSASKTWNLAGLNCSFAIIENQSLRDRFKAACQSSVPPVPTLAFTATEAAYAEGGPWRLELLSYLRGNYEAIVAFFAESSTIQVEPLQATYLAWLDATALGLDDAQGFFEKHGVGLSSGEQFGQPGYLRFNFACPRPMLLDGLQRMKHAMESL